MNNKDTEYIVRAIRTKYTGRRYTALDELIALDKKAKRPADILAYVLGGIGALVMGAGMSMVMTDIGASIGVDSPLVPGIIIGIAGMALAIVNYPIYRAVLSSRRKKFAAEVNELSDKLLNEKK